MPTTYLASFILHLSIHRIERAPGLIIFAEEDLLIRLIRERSSSGNNAPRHQPISIVYRRIAKMVGSAVCLLSILSLSSAQLASVPKRVRDENRAKVVQSTNDQDDASVFGRTQRYNVRHGAKNEQRMRELQFSMSTAMMSMSVPLDETRTPTFYPSFEMPTYYPTGNYPTYFPTHEPTTYIPTSLPTEIPTATPTIPPRLQNTKRNKRKERKADREQAQPTPAPTTKREGRKQRKKANA